MLNKKSILSIKDVKIYTFNKFAFNIDNFIKIKSISFHVTASKKRTKILEKE